MTEDREFPCDICGEVFPDALSLGRHKHSEHPKSKAKSKGQGGSRAESLLTEDDLAELRETEKANRQLELEAKHAELELRKLKAMSEMKKYESAETAPKERTWVLPDGTSFTGSSSDYREMLQLYLQMQSVAKKATSESENPTTIKALLDRIAELEKITTESKLKDVNDKLNYLASRDPLEQANEAIAKFNQMAVQQGMVRAGTSVADEVKLKHSDIQVKALGSAIDSLSKKIDKSMERAERLETNAIPILKKLGDVYIDDFRARHQLAIGEPVPISDHEIAIISKNLEKNDIQQEISNKPAEPPEQKPQPKPEPPKMKEYKFTGTNPLPGYDRSKESVNND